MNRTRADTYDRLQGKSFFMTIHTSIKTHSEYDDHRMLSTLVDPQAELFAYIAIHRGAVAQPAFGATRILPYSSEEAALADALKLSKTMTYKAALAGLPYGGAKAVIRCKPNTQQVPKILAAYAKRVNSFGGHFITGADVGVTPIDLKKMAKLTPYIVGRFVDPVFYTIMGVIEGMRVALTEVFGSDSLSHRSIAIQGLGKTGHTLLAHIYNQAKTIYVSDIHAPTVTSVKKKFPRVIVTKPNEILTTKADVVAPCALSNVINKTNTKTLRCAIIAGSANNQLDESATGERLHRMGVLYAPDYVINAGGLMSVVDEYEHKKPNNKRIMGKIHSIPQTLRTILDTSKRTGKATNIIADAMARKRADMLI